ncbi:hypothetical protein [Halalkalibacter oceani]|uniref:Uncharacterized protein n=1 Tax=Halalkalibacter oceani TaxID=1653776 RepID=A0A9X2DRV7_9BACI|nr:hypothetical protein [Halalkalibacter oceani]MCM3715323.1 hypothetical protein [Halalkalibacter oceani]
MNIEFFPEATRLLQNEEEKVTMDYMTYSWDLPTIAVRPPYYSNPVYEPYYPAL